MKTLGNFRHLPRIQFASTFYGFNAKPWKIPFSWTASATVTLGKCGRYPANNTFLAEVQLRALLGAQLDIK